MKKENEGKAEKCPPEKMETEESHMFLSMGGPCHSTDIRGGGAIVKVKGRVFEGIGNGVVGESTFSIS